MRRCECVLGLTVPPTRRGTEHFHVPFYMQDALEQLVSAPPKDETPVKFLASYFQRWAVRLVAAVLRARAPH